MSKFARGIKAGVRVKQGQTIGYVGSTGLATGPHLHYEFHVNGKHTDPLKVRFPNASTIDSSQLTAFKTKFKSLQKELNNFQSLTAKL